MIKSVWVENNIGQRLDIDLRRSGDELGLYLFNIDGLGAPGASVNGAGGPNFDGVRVNSVKVDPRQIIITLATTAQGTSEEAVKALIYKYFPYKQSVRFGVSTDANEVYIEGIVESLEPNQFSKIENYVIGLYCPRPYWRDVSAREYSITNSSGIPLFQFPFSNNSLTQPLLIFGEATILPAAIIPYYGGVETGLEIGLYFYGHASDIKITNTNGKQSMRLWLTQIEALIGPVQANDRIIINTNIGEKSAIFHRGGEEYNIINSILIGEDWIKLLPGINTIIVTASEGEDLIKTDIRFVQLRGMV